MARWVTGNMGRRRESPALPEALDLTDDEPTAVHRPARVVEPPPLPYYRALQAAQSAYPRSFRAPASPSRYDLPLQTSETRGERRRGSALQLVLFAMALCGASSIIAYRNGVFHAWAQKANFEAAYVHWERELLGGPPMETPLGIERFIQATKDERTSHADDTHSIR